jgi:hypothetical protein
MESATFFAHWNRRRALAAISGVQATLLLRGAARTQRPSLPPVPRLVAPKEAGRQTLWARGRRSLSLYGEPQGREVGVLHEGAGSAHATSTRLDAQAPVRTCQSRVCFSPRRRGACLARCARAAPTSSSAFHARGCRQFIDPTTRRGPNDAAACRRCKRLSSNLGGNAGRRRGGVQSDGRLSCTTPDACEREGSQLQSRVDR